MAIEQTTRPRTGTTTGAGAPMVTVPGPDPDRILLIGDEALLLAGATHEAGLTGELARSLGGRTGRGAVVEAIARPGLRLPDVAALLPAVRLERFDAVVLVAAEDPDASTAAWRQDLGALLHALEHDCSRDTSLVVAGAPTPAAAGLRGRLAARRGRHLLDASRIVVEARPHGRYVSLDGGVQRADAVAAALAPVLATSASAPAGGRSVRAATDDDDARVDAVAKTGLARPGGDPRFAALAQQAKDLLGGETAVIGFIDADTHWITAAAGASAESLPRSVSFCNHTIRSEAPFVVGDLAADDRFAGNPLVDEHHVRFYAGYPIESIEGYRIGSICVLGGTPRDPSTVDVAALQTLAHAARTQIWALSDARA